MCKIFSRVKLTYLFTNRFLSLDRLVFIQLSLMLRPSRNKNEIKLYQRYFNVISTLFQHRTPMYQRSTMLKIQRRILFHFQRRINFISTLLHNVETALIQRSNVGWEVCSLVSMYFNSPQLGKLYKTLDYWSRDMVNFNFPEKYLGLVPPSEFVHEKCFSCYILLTELISLSSCLYFSKYWAICVLRLFFNQAMMS